MLIYIPGVLGLRLICTNHWCIFKIFDFSSGFIVVLSKSERTKSKGNSRKKRDMYVSVHV